MVKKTYETLIAIEQHYRFPQSHELINECQLDICELFCGAHKLNLKYIYYTHAMLGIKIFIEKSGLPRLTNYTGRNIYYVTALTAPSIVFDSVWQDGICRARVGAQ